MWEGGREKGNEILELKCNLENKKEEVSSVITLLMLEVAFVHQEVTFMTPQIQNLCCM